MSARGHLHAVRPADGVQAENAQERPLRTSGLTIEVTIRSADGAGASERRERQLRAIVRLLRRAAALEAEARRAA